MIPGIDRSIDRAVALLGTPRDYDDYVLFKVRPVSSGCCCFHCWPITWAELNEYIYPSGPVKDEGDALVKKDSAVFVLECHESGPEIIVYLGVAIALGELAKAIIELITTILNARRKESKASVKYKLTSKSRSGVEEIELSLPLSDEAVKQLQAYVEKSLENKSNN
jgi:hypothetical protein